ncbi:MAG: hypothetical protein ASARMPREDX12_004245 [Alectoria sarmentosa]|nr:MAG: hypothetical protein ASARMPREDX12_004245 [Alectoria sarmentosa]
MSIAAIANTGLSAALSAAVTNFTSNLTAISNLPQHLTNGASQLGTLAAPNLPTNWLSHSGSGAPWGQERSYDFTIARGTIAPDGYEKDVLLINGQFPGPTIEANWGDIITVTVNNAITGPEEGTALHWHGLIQTDTPWEDGVPAVSQCPIAPGKSLTYSFIADLYGTSWYHSHYSAQYAGGLIGPMIIHGPDSAQYDIDLGPVLLTDYYHKAYFDILEEVMGTNLSLIAPKSVNNLINGKMDYNCSLVTDGTPCTNDAGLAKFQFTTGKTHRLRLINAGAEGIQKFSIDGHTMTVIANDFVPVRPYETEIVTLGIGQRTDVVVQATGNPASVYWMRSTISNCSLTIQPDARAIIYYPSAPTNAKPNTTAWIDDTPQCANDPLSSTTPVFPITPTPGPATTITLTIGDTINSTGNFLWTVNSVSFRADYNSPLLLLANVGNTSYPYAPEWNVYNTGNASSVRLIVENNTPAAHPMHLHGHNMYILDEGLGSWDGSVVNSKNPQRRDVQLMQPDGYMVVQYDAVNPGVWPFHCHIAWHVSGGLYINLLELPAEIAEYHPPASSKQTCVDWADYTNVDVVDQIDSGL